MEINFKAFIFDMDGTLVDSFLDFDSMREELNFPKGVPLLEYIESMGERITPVSYTHLTLPTICSV